MTEPFHPQSGFTWPEGKKFGASFTFDVDAESGALAHDSTFHKRMSLMTHQHYGPTVAVPKLLALLDHHDIKATFFVPGYTADLYPDMVRSLADAGHEIGHHGWMHEKTTALTDAQEAEMLDRGLESLAKVGVTPVGYRAPWWEYNYRTTELLLERGFDYDSSLLDGDVPYRFRSADGAKADLVEVPVDWAMDDWEQFAFYPEWTGSGVIESPRKALEMWSYEGDVAASAGNCWVLTNHPFISGRPTRLAALSDLITHLKSLPGAWITTLAQIAEHTRTAVGDVREHRRIPDPGPQPGQGPDGRPQSPVRDNL
ncbi:polysaccharide deacetylase family protein [Calidifontibacter indicus]|uniref:polysaccharide deacetylase family protein n=1 Tax=Calidifontibacter indicus TaxID=419650 RepID=UPI003D7129A9